MHFDPEELIRRFEHVVVDGEDLAAKHQKVTDALKDVAEALAPEITLPQVGEEVKVALAAVAKIVHAGIDQEAAKAESGPTPTPTPSTAPEPTAGQSVTPGPIVTTEPAPYVDPTAGKTSAPVVTPTDTASVAPGTASAAKGVDISVPPTGFTETPPASG